MEKPAVDLDKLLTNLAAEPLTLLVERGQALGDQSDIRPERFGDDIEVATSLDGAGVDVLTKAGVDAVDVLSQADDTRLDRVDLLPEASFGSIDPLIEAGFDTIDTLPQGDEAALDTIDAHLKRVKPLRASGVGRTDLLDELLAQPFEARIEHTHRPILSSARAALSIVSVL